MSDHQDVLPVADSLGGGRAVPPLLRKQTGSEFGQSDIGSNVQAVYTPCPERGCPHYFTWRDLQELNNTDFYNLVKEEKLVCRGGHPRQTELIFPKAK
ncbi:uncharacterized protein si:ch211-210p4.6 [Siniperca chuatsi]|uniref:uncharacterized protein si:ch211-210p4.6 n=1 Tax=Siniperca chuatsi TaxID=119488 RepID=UPI001CE17DF0|nr:uncharacterized protein si:ch211-210p4.6 [Siniperca chuatsi]